MVILMRRGSVGAAGRCAAALLSVFLAGRAHADAGWFESGDVGLRVDLQLLNDAEVIRLPINEWPLPRAAVRFALSNARDHVATNGAVEAALTRVRARLDVPSHLFGISATAGDPALLRTFGTPGREKGEIAGLFNDGGEGAEVSLRIAAEADPEDDHVVRADGSHATLLLGNWLVSANTLERFWGPSHESSLILSNNARPMATLMVERAEPRPFESSWLSWLGPWRMSFGISRMESQREDIDAPLFMAWRIEIMPFKDIEFGFSRTAQFCGKQLECNLSVFGNLLVGNDNVGIDATAANEPGNQMAGFDIRWNSPIGNLPYAIYSQYIGEDESGYLPAKYLAQIGAEIWKPLGGGGIIQTFAEWSGTTCSVTARRTRFDCAYNQGRFSEEGYRYEGRVIGYTTDRDASIYSLGASYVEADGSVWTATARSAQLHRGPNIDFRNTVSPVPARYAALEFGWRGQWKSEELAASLGVQALEPRSSGRDTRAFGFVRWTHQFPL